ncbi:MAG: T9SS type A sorting domain-containing protein [Bacteroidales bacterium]|nr:T9SS type A sorting domain-containing protein [Bacteroidales bacterium]
MQKKFKNFGKVGIMLLIAGMAFSATSRERGSFIESITDSFIGETTYDKNTNQGARNQIVVWEDGWISAVFMQSHTTGQADMGTGYAYYDGNEWHASVARIEGEKTGFGTIARYGNNGVIVAAQTDDNKILLLTCENRMGNNWVIFDKIYTGAGNPNRAIFPSVTTSGPNNDIVHLVTVTDENVLYYSRTPDGGNTWDIDLRLDYFQLPYAKELGANSYYFMETTSFNDPVIPNRISLVIADRWSDGHVIYSDNNGDTWNRKVFYNHPNVYASSLDFGSLDSDGILYPYYTSAAWDSKGDLHVAFECGWSNDANQYLPGLGCILYWNEDMPAYTINLIEEIEQTNWIYRGEEPMPSNYVGYIVPIDENTSLPYNGDLTDFPYSFTDFGAHGKYNRSTAATMPTITIDKNDDKIYFVFASMTDYTLDATTNEYYFRLYSRFSEDLGKTWSDIEALNKGSEYDGTECVFPWMSDKSYASENERKIHVIYQRDSHTGSAVDGSHPISVGDNNYQALTIKVRASQDAPAAPTLANATATTITLTTVAGCEYRRDGGDWQPTPLFSGLSPNTPYSFTQRYAETASHYASPESPSATFTTTDSDKPLYTITATVNNLAYGAITPAGEVIVEDDDDITFIITANAGYHIETVLVDGANNPNAVAAGSYTFNNVSADHEIHVVFAEGVGIGDVKTDNYPSLQVYPNPTSGLITICDVRCEICDVAIYDVMGRAVSTHILTIHYSLPTLDLSHLPTGVYFLQVTTENGSVTRKVVKQ